MSLFRVEVFSHNSFRSVYCFASCSEDAHLGIESQVKNQLDTIQVGRAWKLNGTAAV